MVRSTTILVVFCLLTTAGSALADKDRSVEYYNAGKKKYNLGEFDEAIELFKKAYDEFEAPAYLYNIAQAYRQKDDCKKALFFYERFLAEKPDSDQADAVRGHIETLKTECAGDLETGEPQPEDAPSSGVGETQDTDSGGASQPAASGAEVGANIPVEPTAESAESSVVVGPTPADVRAPLLALTLEVGPSFYSMGEVVVPVAGALRLGAAYPRELGPVSVEAGVSAILERMEYQKQAGEASVLFTTLLATVAVGYPLSDVMRVGGELGLGMFSFSGLESGNPFLDGQMAQEGTARSFCVRLGGSFEYALATGLNASFAPALLLPSTDEGLAAHVGSIRTLQLLAGAHYRW